MKQNIFDRNARGVLVKATTTTTKSLTGHLILERSHGMLSSEFATIYFGIHEFFKSKRIQTNGIAVKFIQFCKQFEFRLGASHFTVQFNTKFRNQGNQVN